MWCGVALGMGIVWKEGLVFLCSSLCRTGRGRRDGWREVDEGEWSSRSRSLEEGRGVRLFGRERREWDTEIKSTRARRLLRIGHRRICRQCAKAANQAKDLVWLVCPLIFFSFASLHYPALSRCCKHIRGNHDRHDSMCHAARGMTCKIKIKMSGNITRCSLRMQ